MIADHKLDPNTMTTNQFIKWLETGENIFIDGVYTLREDKYLKP